MHKHIISSILLCFISISMKAQVEQDIIRPSINADQFGIGAKAEVALSKGQLSVNIPLMELKGKGYNLPISLAFYGGDISSQAESSPVGLGWALMAGGVIGKTIKGADDTAPNGNSYQYHYNDDFLHEDWNYYTYLEQANILEEIRRDPMPDDYTYSIPGHSGTIDVTYNNGTVSRKLYPDETYQIEETERGFCITDDDGTKFYFEDIESRTASSYDFSASLFLSRIVTVKGGLFTFNYAKEEYVDLTTREGDSYFEAYTTNRITSIEFDYGTVTFFSEIRDDRGSYGNQEIPRGLESKRINKIELRDEDGRFVKGYELDNSGWITHFNAPSNPLWVDIRHILSSVTQYDSMGNRLPPYRFEYSHDLRTSKLAESFSHSLTNGECEPKDSWNTPIGSQAFAHLDYSGNPVSPIYIPGTNTPDFSMERPYPTVFDYFCLDTIIYPTGAREEFAYEEHDYGKINSTRSSSSYGTKIQGRRLASRKRYGTDFHQQTDYKYQLHDSNYNITSHSSGVLTNPCIHRATYYTTDTSTNGIAYVASKITSERAFNSYMGTPVFYTEVEEIERNIDIDGIAHSRTIHYYEPNIVQPPTNYIFVKSDMDNSSISFVEIPNRIFGERHSYLSERNYFNGVNMIYLTYPVGEFSVDTYIGSQPLKEVVIGKEGKVRSIKKFNYYDFGSFTKYGYKIDKQEVRQGYNTIKSIYRFSKTDYNIRRFRLINTYTTQYYYDGDACDSICDKYAVYYNKGRVYYTYNGRNDGTVGSSDYESQMTKHYFPDDVANNTGGGNSPELQCLSSLLEKNIIGGSMKTVIKRDGVVVGGDCKEYQIHSGMPLLKSVFKMKNSANNADNAPRVMNDTIDYRADLYKEGEILSYDEDFNPQHVRINNCQDRIYVWGYGGRHPIAFIDNMDSETFNASATLKAAISSLGNYRAISNGMTCWSLRNTNNTIRNLLPADAHITTFTYDPNFGITSEMDDSNTGTIYTYDSFGRLTAKYNEEYKKTEEYNYNYYLQHQ